MLGYLSADIICSEKRTVFRERSARKTVSYEEQIMSKDKYPNIFSPQMVTIVFIILQIFFATRAVLKIGECSRTCRIIFGHVTCLDQSRASKTIWWSIISDIPQFELGNIRSRDKFRPIAREQKDLMDYNAGYLLPTDDRYWEHHDHIWIVLQFVE